MLVRGLTVLADDGFWFCLAVEQAGQGRKKPWLQRRSLQLPMLSCTTTPSLRTRRRRHSLQCFARVANSSSGQESGGDLPARKCHRFAQEPWPPFTSANSGQLPCFPLPILRSILASWLCIMRRAFSEHQSTDWSPVECVSSSTCLFCFRRREI